MIPKRVELENFLSFGPATVIAFDDDEPLWVVAGPNGVGKSSVFDAITYALYGEHRGGSNDAVLLIRHGADSFRIVFDFEFNGVDFRITRTRRRAGGTTQKVERLQKDDDGWEPVPNVSQVREVKAWAEDLLGLGYEAFTASVLLRQGHADEIITGKPADRLGILKKIIGCERYEALSARVHDKTSETKRSLDHLKKLRDPQASVAEAELAAAQQAHVDAEQALVEAEQQSRDAEQRISSAKSWENLAKKDKECSEKLDAADRRAVDAERIHAGKLRFDELTATLPKLKQLVEARASLAVEEPKLRSMLQQHDEQTQAREPIAQSLLEAKQREVTHRSEADQHEREASRLRGEIKREEPFVKAAVEVAKLQAERDDFPRDLAAQVAAAKQQAGDADAALTSSKMKRAELEGLLKAAQQKQRQFATVGVGVPCSACGQLVTPQHAETERATLAAEVENLTRQVQEAKHAETRANQTKQAATVASEQLDEKIRSFTQKEIDLAKTRQWFVEHAVSGDAAELRRLLAEKSALAMQHEQNRDQHRTDLATVVHKANLLETDLKKCDASLQTTAARLKDSEKNLDRFRAQRELLESQLSPDWRERSATLDQKAVRLLESEHGELERSNVRQQFQQLQEDKALRPEWEKQRETILADMEAIPAASRVPVAVAEQHAKSAKQHALDTGKTRDAARDTLAELQRRDKEQRAIIEKIVAAERIADRHDKLDKLLGKAGLQRELVRTAEREIVERANQTVQALSDGDLAIELYRSDNNDDKAFELNVRRGGVAEPIPVDFLSGSQKFRVAVSVALAIGQYASGQDRPLECVIIDEGFGSLDRDGLRATADELNRLRTTNSLRRIVLVSHQEDFADRFPVVIQLVPGEAGTTATAVRR